MPKIPVVIAALAAALWLAASPARAEVTATGAAFVDIPGGTRFVLEVSGEPRHRIFAVDDPPRLVVDLDGLAFDLSSPPPASGLVDGWRFGALDPGSGRIVFDLAEPALVSRRFFLPELAGRPARLVLDLRTAAPAAFARAAGAATAAPVELAPQAADPDGPLVVIDPGHGGIDPGAVTDDGLREKDVVMAFARRVRERLEAVPGIAARLTRTDDRFLPLAHRIRIARAYGADLFISIHADAAPQDYVRGATVYTLSERPSDAQAAALAARENLADRVSGAIEPERQETVSGILADLLRRETKSYSHDFAERLIARMERKVRMNSNPHRSARFRVLMAHDIPSVLLELGYLTNADDTEALTTPEWQEKASAAVAAAIRDYFADGHAVAPDRQARGPETAVR
jgi:N-acetylmuramoyl-L-alanine amidase